MVIGLALCLAAISAPAALATPHPGQSLNVAIIGSPLVINGGTLPTTGPAGELGDFNFTNLAPAAVSAAGLAPYDTAVLNVASVEMGCTTAPLTAAAKAALVSFVASGKKMIIYDSECAIADYSWLPFPFTTNNPGQQGATGTLTDVEENLLSSLIPADPHFIDTAQLSTGTDAVGDANVFVTNDANWCVDMTARNTNNVVGATHTYAKTGVDAGLYIYNGLDTDYINFTGPGDNLRKIWVQELQQPFNPSNLPCGVAVVGITLTPASAVNVVGTTHTVTANLKNLEGIPQSGKLVTFTVLSGPNAGLTGTATTDAAGNASMTYAGMGGVGTDEIQACFDNAGTEVCSQNVTKTWTPPPTKISVNDVSVKEGNTQLSPPTPAPFTITLDQPSTQPVTVKYQTVNGTASSVGAADYVAKTGTVTFSPGDTSETVTIDVRGDLIDEPNETFRLVLSMPTNATIADGDGLGTIIDDDRSGKFSCRAYGVKLAGIETALSNGPNSPCKDASASVLDLPLLGGTLGLGAKLISSSTNQTPDDLVNTAPAVGDRSEADAEASTVVLVVGLTVVRADVVKVYAQARCGTPLGSAPALSATTTIVNLTVNGQPVVVGNAEIKINLLLGVLHINNTTKTATSITRRGIWFQNTLMPSSLDIVVAEAKANFSGNPCK